MSKTKHTPFNTRELSVIEKLGELYEIEHGDCESSTCGMSVAYRYGYTLHAIDCFASSGVTSEDFQRLYAELPITKVHDWSTYEASKFCNEVGYSTCPHCNAVTFEPESVTNKDKIYCDNCTKEYTEQESISYHGDGAIAKAKGASE